MHNSMYYGGFNPYMMPRTSSFRNAIAKINWGSILNNTQKTLNVINQAIPVYYQMKPIYNNAKTMFRIIGNFNDKEEKTIPSSTNTINTNEKNISNQPIFFS